MKNRKWVKYSLFVVGFITLYLVILNFSPGLLADVGNNNRYDSGSSSSGDGDSFFLIYFFELLFRLIFIFGPIPGLIILILLAIVCSVIYKKHGKKIKEAINQIEDIRENTLNETAINRDSSVVIQEIVDIDPNFSNDKFIGWVREVFIKIQQAWSERNWKIIRPFETEELFSQHNMQLEEYIRNGKINKIEKIAIKSCDIINFKVDGDKEVLEVELRAVMRDYVIDEKTNKVLESDPNRDWHMKYIMTFQRKHGVKTEKGRSNMSTTNCPNCGAPTEITSAGQCEYCASVITTGEHDWVLSDIRSIK